MSRDKYGAPGTTNYASKSPIMVTYLQTLFFRTRQTVELELNSSQWFEEIVIDEGITCY